LGWEGLIGGWLGSVSSLHLLSVDDLFGVVGWDLLVHDDSSARLSSDSTHLPSPVINISHAATETAPNSAENDGDIGPVKDPHDEQHEE